MQVVIKLCYNLPSAITPVALTQYIENKQL